MSEEIMYYKDGTTISHHQTQKKIKPKIEDIIPDYLNGDMRKAALDFVAYMRANKMQPVWTSINSWKASYKGKGICYVRLPNDNCDVNSWVVTPLLNHIDKYEKLIMNEGLQNIIWNNLYYCTLCCHSVPCNIKDLTILGKEFKGICGGRAPMWFFNPDEAAVNCIKRLLDLEQKARVENIKNKQE